MNSDLQQSKINEAPADSKSEEQVDQQENSQEIEDIKSNECEKQSKENCPEGEVLDDADSKSEEPQKDQNEDSNQRFKIQVNDYSSMRRQISFAIYALKDGNTIQISGFGIIAEKAVRMAEIIKLRLGMLHQETKIISNKVSYQNDAFSKDSTGILIKLSKSPLDKNSVGYQKPKPVDETLLPMRDQFRGSLRNRERLPGRFNSEKFASQPMARGVQRFPRSPLGEFGNGFPRYNQQQPFSRAPPMGGPRIFNYSQRNGLQPREFRSFGPQQPFRYRDDNQANRSERGPTFRDSDRLRRPIINENKPFRTDRPYEGNGAPRSGTGMRGRPMGQRGGLRA